MLAIKGLMASYCSVHGKLIQDGMRFLFDFL